jgi:DNA-binding CsgD family transcriptional regulator
MNKPHETVVDFAASLSLLGTKQDVWRAFADFAGQYGFRYAGYWDVPGPGERLEDNLICGSSLQEWHAHYCRNNYILSDPLVLHVSRTALPYTLQDALSCPDYTAEQRRVRDEAAEFGVKASFFIPLRSPRNGPSLISLGGEVPLQLHPSERADLHLAAICTDACLRPMAPKHDAALPVLTDRERECLQWVAMGKSDHDIAEILRISDKTVNFHIESVKRKYSVSSRNLAASMAVRAGVIHF